MSVAFEVEGVRLPEPFFPALFVQSREISSCSMRRSGRKLLLWCCLAVLAGIACWLSSQLLRDGGVSEGVPLDALPSLTPQLTAGTAPDIPERRSNASAAAADEASDPSLVSTLDKVEGLSAHAAPLLTAAETYHFFENTLVIMMMSPSRYHLVKNVYEHYKPFFKHMYFCGPQPADLYGIHISGFDIVYGNEQYRAVAKIIRDYVVNKSAVFDGVLYIGDDVMLQPWSIAGKRFNKNIPWATQMGIANLNNMRTVSAVPGMSVQGKYRAQWPYWAKNRKKLVGVLEEGGAPFRDAMYRAAKATHPLIYKWSRYSFRAMTDEALHNVIFYTIVDTYYIPWRLAMAYADRCDLMAKHWIFGECAIATAIRSLSPIYEQMDIQFYWSTLSAADCHRYKWAPMIDGFHRCRHDHKFAHLMYSSDAARASLKSNRTFMTEALRLNGLDPVPDGDVDPTQAPVWLPA